MFATCIGSILNEFWPNAPAWLSTRVFLCAASVVGLLLLSLLLRGLQRVLTVVIFGVLALGACWFIEDLRAPRAGVLPGPLLVELDEEAARELVKPEAKAAWETIQREMQSIQGEARARLAGGGDAARQAIARRLEAKVAELKKQGKRLAAEELARLRAEVLQ